MTRLLRRYNKTMNHVLPATVSISCPRVCPSIMATITRIVRSIGFPSNLPRFFFSTSLSTFLHVFSCSFGNSRTKVLIGSTPCWPYSHFKHRSTDHGTLVLVPRGSRRMSTQIERMLRLCVKEPVTFSPLYCCTLQHRAMLRSQDTRDNILFLSKEQAAFFSIFLC